MGRDKALVPYLGVPMAARVASALRDAGCAPVVAVGGDAAGLGAIGLEVVPDRWPGEGPVGGVITALEHEAGADVVVVVSCDLPLLRGETVRALVAALDAPAGALAAVAVTDRLQPLCVAWRPAAAAELATSFAAGERRVRAALASLEHVEVSVDRQDLRNVNATRDLRH